MGRNWQSEWNEYCHSSKLKHGRRDANLQNWNLDDWMRNVISFFLNAALCHQRSQLWSLHQVSFMKLGKTAHRSFMDVWSIWKFSSKPPSTSSWQVPSESWRLDLLWTRKAPWCCQIFHSATNKPAHHLISSPIIQKMIWKQWILNIAEILFINRMHVLPNLSNSSALGNGDHRQVWRLALLWTRKAPWCCQIFQKVLLWGMETIDRFGAWLCFEHARLLGEGSKVTIHHHLSGPNRCAHTQTLV